MPPPTPWEPGIRAEGEGEWLVSLQLQAPTVGTFLHLPPRREWRIGLGLHSPSSRAESVGAYPHLVPPFLAAEPEPELATAGTKPPGQLLEPRESQVSEDTDLRASPDSMALLSALLPQVVGDLEFFFPGEGAFPHSL